MTYLLTISKSKKKEYVSVKQIQEVMQYLADNGVGFSHIMALETHGKYRQLHFHGVVFFDGRYSPLSSYGDGEHTSHFKITWSPIFNFKKCVAYIYKQTHNNHIVQDQILKENFFTYYYNPFW